MRHLADNIIGDSIVAEMTPFYFREDGREYMESVPFVYVGFCARGQATV